MADETAEALLKEAKDGLESGASVQILIEGYPTWIAVTEIWGQGSALLHLHLADKSGILIGKNCIIGVRFGALDDED